MPELNPDTFMAGQQPPELNPDSFMRGLAQAPTKEPTQEQRSRAPGVPEPPLPEGLKSDQQIAAEAPFATNVRTGERYQTTPMGQSVLDFPYKAAVHAAHGVEALAPENPDESIISHAISHPKDAARGASELIQGGMEAATPFMVAGGIAAPVKTAAVLGSAYVAQKGTTAGLNKLGVAPEYSDLAGQLAGIVAGYGVHWATAPPEVKALVEAAQPAKEQGGAEPGQAPGQDDSGLIARLKVMAQQHAQSPKEAKLARDLLRRRFNIDIPEPAAAAEAPAPSGAPPAGEPLNTDTFTEAAKKPTSTEPSMEASTPPAKVSRADLKPDASFDTPSGPVKITKVRGGLVTYTDAKGNETQLPTRKFLALATHPAQQPAEEPAPTPTPEPVPQATPESVVAPQANTETNPPNTETLPPVTAAIPPPAETTTPVTGTTLQPPPVIENPENVSRETPAPPESQAPPVEEKAVESESGPAAEKAGDDQRGTVPEPRQPSHPVARGAETVVEVEGRDQPYKARYTARELSDTHPSHNPFTFERNPQYHFINDRDYSLPENRARVTSGKLKPHKVINDNPDATNGPSVIESQGNVLGGNNRRMRIERAYAADPKGGQGYKQYLIDKAKNFGLDPAEIKKMKQPVLDRELDEAELDPQRAITDLNKTPTAELSTGEQAAADARGLTLETGKYIGAVLESAGPDATLTDVLNSKRGPDIVNRLIDAGIFTSAERPALLDATTGAVTPEAKTRIAKMLLGGLFKDSEKFQSAEPSLRNKLERVAPIVKSIESNPEWNLLPDVRKAIEQIEFEREYGKAYGLKPGESFQIKAKRSEHQGAMEHQAGMFGETPPPPEATEKSQALAEFIRKNSPTAVAKAFRAYAEKSTETNFFNQASPADAFADAFSQPQRMGAEAGSAPMIMDLAKGINDFFDDKGASGDLLRRNLNFITKKAPELDAAALKASGWKGLAAAIMYTTTPAMDKALEGNTVGADVEEVINMLIDGRLRGIREGVWRGTAREVSGMGKKAIIKNFAGFTRLLDAMSGRAGFSSKLSQAAAARLEQGKINALREFLVEAFWEAGERVATAMPAERFDRMTANPQVQRAVRIYKENAEPAMADLHGEHEGVFSENLGPLDTYIPLIPLKEEEVHPGGAGVATPYIKPKNMANRMATGLSKAYDPSLPTFRKTLEKRTHSSTKFDLLRQVQSTKWGTPLGEDDDPHVFTDKYGNEWPGSPVEMAPGKTLIRPGEKPIPVGKRYMVIPTILKNELDVILRGPDYDEAPNKYNAIIHKLNSVALAAPALMESVFHSKNLVGALYQNTPAIASAVGKAALRKMFGEGQNLANVMNASPSQSSFMNDLVKMGRLGLLADRFAETSYSRKLADLLGDEGSVIERFTLKPALFGPHGLDIMARWILFKAKEAADPTYSARDMADYVNQAGVYVNGQQSRIVKFLRAKGFNPFAVAGTAGIGRGLRSLVGGRPPISFKKSPVKNIGWRLAYALVIGSVMSWILWEIGHRYTTGRSPVKDPRAKLNKIPVTGAARNSKWAQALAPGTGTLYVNIQVHNPDLARGLRATGLESGFQTWNAGGNAQQVATAAAVDMLNEWSSVLTGPALRAGIAAAGFEPHLNSLMDAQGANEASIMRSLPRKNVPFRVNVPFTKTGHTMKGGSANVAWRGKAAMKELNSMFGVVGEDIGLLPRNPDTKEGTLPRSAVDMLIPGLVSGPSNPFAAAQRIQKQRTALGR